MDDEKQIEFACSSKLSLNTKSSMKIKNHLTKSIIGPGLSTLDWSKLPVPLLPIDFVQDCMLVNSDPESVFDIKDVESSPRWFQAMLNNWKDDFYAGQVVNAAAPNDMSWQMPKVMEQYSEEQQLKNALKTRTMPVA